MILNENNKKKTNKEKRKFYKEKLHEKFDDFTFMISSKLNILCCEKLSQDVRLGKFIFGKSVAEMYFGKTLLFIYPL